MKTLIMKVDPNWPWLEILDENGMFLDFLPDDEIKAHGLDKVYEELRSEFSVDKLGKEEENYDPYGFSSSEIKNKLVYQCFMFYDKLKEAFGSKYDMPDYVDLTEIYEIPILSDP